MFLLNGSSTSASQRLGLGVRAPVGTPNAKEWQPVRTRQARNGRHAAPGSAGGGIIPLRCVSHSDFERDFERLRDTVQAACSIELRWEAKVAAVLSAVLEFAASEPSTARELTARGQYSSRRADEVIAYFTDLLRDTAPARGSIAVSTAEAMVECVATVIRGSLLAGRAEALPGLAPELVSMVLLPYTGSDVAASCSDRIAQGLA
jgi:hypothetical protein